MNDDFKFFITFLLLFCNGSILQVYLNYLEVTELKRLLIMPSVITILSWMIWLVSKSNSSYKKNAFRLSIFCLIGLVFWALGVIYLTALAGAYNH